MNCFEVEVKGGICCFVRDKACEDTCEYSLQKDGDCESTDLDLSSLDVMIRELVLQGLFKWLWSKF